MELNMKGKKSKGRLR